MVTSQTGWEAWARQPLKSLFASFSSEKEESSLPIGFFHGFLASRRPIANCAPAPHDRPVPDFPGADVLLDGC
jgi:hypothetical protein